MSTSRSTIDRPWWHETADPSWLGTGTVLFDTGGDDRGPTASAGALLPNHARIVERSSSG